MIENIIGRKEEKDLLARFTITKDYDKVLRNKIVCFQEETKSRKSILLTLITSYGLKKGIHTGMVQNEVLLDDLFV